MTATPADQPPIVVTGVAVQDDAGRVLTVRKRGTERFMLPGGKPEPGESPAQTGARELGEELGLRVDPASMQLLGAFMGPTANEPGRVLQSTVFHARPEGEPRPAAEIDEMRWLPVDPEELAAAIDPALIAPMLAENVLPVLRAARAEEAAIARLVDEAPSPGEDIGSDGVIIETFGGRPDGVRPVTVLVHGGFWRPTIDRTHLRAAAHMLADHGFVVALPEYRREPGNPQAALDDLLAVDDQLAAGGWYDAPVPSIWVGHSAGGHLAMLRGLQPDRPHVGVLSLAGVNDLARAADEHLGFGAAHDWVGSAPQEDRDTWARLDPRRLWPDAGRDHVLLVHGSEDATVPAAHSEDFPAPARIVPGAHHADLVDPTSPHWHHVQAAWLELYASMFQPPTG
ncbi:NUDIX domain-containing protein [Kytococcus sedentarius]|uniref:NUDIX domain-containing protein n=1 Tax=Kytococcus sedentarius TaxID=1276 RepID=UPI0035BBE04F